MNNGDVVIPAWWLIQANPNPPKMKSWSWFKLNDHDHDECKTMIRTLTLPDAGRWRTWLKHNDAMFWIERMLFLNCFQWELCELRSCLPSGSWRASHLRLFGWTSWWLHGSLVVLFNYIIIMYIVNEMNQPTTKQIKHNSPASCTVSSLEKEPIHSRPSSST